MPEDATGSPRAPAAPTGVYVHVPFCRQLCPYCDFTIVRSEPRAMEPLAAALRREWRERASGLLPRTLYFGGGTPTELPARLLTALIREFRGAAPAGTEITVEANPESASPRVLDGLREAGVTRLSLGVQSTDPGLLATLGRGHSREQARSALEAARAAGIPGVNVDLMFGLPGQTDGQWEQTLAEVLDWGPDHLSAYALELSPRVPMARRIASGRLAAQPDEATERMYVHLCQGVAAAGYEHYEISNFARPGFRSQHNQGYWNGAPYVGLGPGAHSFSGTGRSWNARPLREYIRLVEAGGTAEAGREELDPGQLELERLYLALRTSAGLDLGEGAAAPGAAPGSPLSRESRAAALSWAGRQDRSLVVRAGTRVHLTERGFWYSDALIADLAGALPAAPSGAALPASPNLKEGSSLGT